MNGFLLLDVLGVMTLIFAFSRAKRSLISLLPLMNRVIFITLLVLPRVRLGVMLISSLFVF